MKKSVKFIILGLVVLAVAGGGIYAMTAPVAVPLTAITARTVELSFTEQGLAVADSVVQVFPEAQGRLLRVAVSEGQTVRAGDIICEIDPEPLYTQISQIESVISGFELQIANLGLEQDRARAELQTSRNRLTAELTALEAQERSSNLSVETLNVSIDERLRLQNVLIEQSAADLARAREELNRANVLYQAGSMSRFEYEAARDTAARSQTALEAAELERGVIAGGRGISSEDYFAGARAALNAQISGITQSMASDYTGAMKDYFRAMIQGSQAELEHVRRMIGNCVITAPTDGIITSLNVKNTNFVTAGVPVAEITNPGNRIEVFISTNDVDSVRPGDEVELTLKRREDDVVFTGEVKDIGATAEIRLSTLGVEERKVRVWIEPHIGSWMLENVSFGVGFEADVRFFVYRADNKFAVPRTALFKDNGKDMLWVVRGGRAEAIEVKTGMALRTETVIEAGLAEGDFVVTDANNRNLRNGVRVTGE
ncbi:MAG: HlyD family secretion protein [Defluviitaleaceae bacterium]|nr:HlyD family secretion protein [Defluviitaleaceae bacterium]